MRWIRFGKLSVVLSPKDRFVLLFAQGFGSGLAKFAPGTFGSLVGLLWAAGLLLAGSWAGFLAGSVATVVLSVYVCGRAETVLREKDPGSVVFDEIAAIPVCLIGWCVYWQRGHGSFPTPGQLFTGPSAWVPWAAFGLFRLFDIWKPTPVRQSQGLPGGWGVTVDDVLAAVYVNLVLVPVLMLAGPR